MNEEKMGKLLEFVAVGVACLLLGAICSRGRQVQVPVLVTQQSGRYQVQGIGGTVWCTDTQTAETWFIKAGKWQQMRMPNDLVPHTTVEPVQEVQDSKFDPYSDEELERIARDAPGYSDLPAGAVVESTPNPTSNKPVMR